MTERNAGQLQHALEAHGAAILNYFERRVERHDAPDLLGNVMLIAWRRVDAMPAPPEQARMWLFGIARNVLRDHQRSARRRLRLADRLRAVTSGRDLQRPPADQHIEVIDAVRRLPVDLREIVMLVHWDGWTLADAATHCGVSASTARGRYQRARGLLRSTLATEHA